MGWFSKLKTGLGIARIFSPKVNEAMEQAEQLHDKVEDAKRIRTQVEEFVEDIREIPDVGLVEWAPGSRPANGGEFLLFRGSMVVRDYQGDLAQHTCKAGRPLPPGFIAGDRWRRVIDMDLSPGLPIRG